MTIKQLVKLDLQADGLVKGDGPFSKFVKRRQSELPSSLRTNPTSRLLRNQTKTSSLSSFQLQTLNEESTRNLKTVGHESPKIVQDRPQMRFANPEAARKWKLNERLPDLGSPKKNQMNSQRSQTQTLPTA